MGASDIMFVLLFYFMMVGGGKPNEESALRLPTISWNSRSDFMENTPCKIDVYIPAAGSAERNHVSMTLNRWDSDETKNEVVFDVQEAGTDSLRLKMADALSKSVGVSSGLAADSVCVLIRSEPGAIYGFVAAVIAACKDSGYRCFLMFEKSQ